MLCIFSCVCYPSVCLLWRNVCLGLFPTFWLGCLFFWCWVVWAAYIFWKLILCQLFHLLLYSPILRIVFSPCFNFLCCAKAFKFNQVPLVYFCFYFCYSRRWVWRRQWHPTPVLLPGKSHGQRSLVGCGPWGRWESDTTEWLQFHFSLFMHWRRKWQPTPVFLPGESQGRGSLVGCRLPGRTESDTTEAT